MTDDHDRNGWNPGGRDTTERDPREREAASTTKGGGVPSGDGQPSPKYREALRAGPGLADIAVSLLLALFPEHDLYRAAAGDMTSLSLDPPLGAEQAGRLEHYLHQLVERPEWRARHGVVREVRDRTGTRLEVRTPAAPAEYRGGEALVGPFEDEAAAEAWGADHAGTGYGHDAIRMAGVWLCDVFDAGEDLTAAWEPGSSD